MDLNNAEIAVTTQHLIDIKDLQGLLAAPVRLQRHGRVPECLFRPVSRGKGTRIPVSEMGKHSGHTDQP